MADIPGHQPVWSRLTRISAAYDIVLAPLAIVGTFVASYAYYWNQQWWRFGLLFGAGSLVLLASTLKAIVALKEQFKKRASHELEGCLHTLHSILENTLDDDAPDPKLRITIHKPVQDGQCFEQVMDYVGAARGRDKTAGRKFPAQSGIIGEAFSRSGGSVVASRRNDDYETYINELKTLWHYTEADARKLNPASMSWMAIPLIESDGVQSEVKGIVFFDSTDRGFFTTEREVLAVSACAGIARFVKSRYNT